MAYARPAHGRGLFQLVSWIGFYDVGAQPPQVVGSPRRRRAANGESESVPTGQWATLARSVADADGHREVVRNGHLPERSILTGIGPVRVKQPRVHDRRPAAEQERFSSKILPPYLRKTRSVEELIPWLYLKGREHGRLHRGARGTRRPRGARADRLHGDTPQERVGAGLQGVESPIAEGRTLRLPVGRRRALQHPARGEPSVHPCPDGRHGGREEGTHRHHRRARRERAVLEADAARRKAARAAG
jgi:hypothetical protein